MLPKNSRVVEYILVLVHRESLKDSCKRLVVCLLISSEDQDIIADVDRAFYSLDAISDYILKYFSSRVDTNVQSLVASETTPVDGIRC